ncbi:hypothetical protein, partial [Micromonospora noduli]|uniref:hypothetical protein n=1 Tax=Micromonospora noduli TaxID=709876 RepID=UPI0014755D13
DELEMLKSLGEKSDSGDLIHRINQLKQCIRLKDKEICELRQLNCANKNMEDIKRRIAQYENDLAKMNEMNRQLKEELDEAGLSLAKVSELEEMLKTERKARNFSEELAKDLEEKLEKETNVQKVKEDLIKLKKQEENLA